MDYKLIRSDRKTLAIQITPEGVVVRAPRRMTDAEIAAQVAAHENWIRTHLAKAEQKRAAAPAANKLTEEELRSLADRALAYLPGRVAYYAQKMGVTYGRVTVRNQRTRWGSCSNKGNLNFNCLLMLTPPEVIDSVVVHELAHRREMNHSKQFYAVVYAAYPEYDRWHGWLKQNGEAILRRMTG